ncbi:MAG: hypothetical protein D6737_10335 [Chloroflexi bacterium]|nr:MAG: hypothetical protein D6737_10335 [Chloroflexota bacterium]
MSAAPCIYLSTHTILADATQFIQRRGVVHESLTGQNALVMQQDKEKDSTQRRKEYFENMLCVLCVSVVQ